MTDPKPLRFDLGSGQHPREGFVGVDRAVGRPGVYGVKFDLVSGCSWPWSDDSVDEFASSHFIEHIQADEVERLRDHGMQDRLFFFFDEAWRCLKPGGLFHLAWPSVKSSDAFRDPTHRRFLPIEFLHYLYKPWREAASLTHYEVRCNFAIDGGKAEKTRGEASVYNMWEYEREIRATLRAVKS